MRRHALLAALVLDLEATITDQIFDMHDRVVGRLFTEAKRKHEQRFTAAGKAINDKVRLYARVGHALMDAREHGGDPYAAIKAVLPWDLFARSVNEADQLAQPASFDPLPLLAEGDRQVGRYALRLLDTFDFRAAPVARDVLEGIEALRHLYRGPGRTLPPTALTHFIRKRWESFVVTADGLDRPLYEIAALTELKNALRSGDMWIPGSRQFKDFEGYLLPPERFAMLRDTPAFPSLIDGDGESYLKTRLALLEHKLRAVDRLAGDGELPDAELSGELLKVTPLRNSVPREADCWRRMPSRACPT